MLPSIKVGKFSLGILIWDCVLVDPLARKFCPWDDEMGIVSCFRIKVLTSIAGLLSGQRARVHFWETVIV